MAIRAPEDVRQLGRTIQEEGGEAYLVGGWVRDQYMEYGSKDFDIEVYHLQPEVLEGIITRYTPKDAAPIGKIYGVYDFYLDPAKTTKVNASIPREERGLTDISINPFMSKYQAVQRRDYRINGLMMNIMTDEVHDYVDGLSDIESRVLSHINPQRFTDDPLRVLRGMSLASRRNLTMTPETKAFCQQMMYMYYSISPSRLWEEWYKWACGQHPEKGLLVLMDTYWINFYPQLSSLIWIPQNPKFHPEGDVWAHTWHVVKEAGGLDPKIVFAALLHDAGKAATTRHGHEITSYEHSLASEVLAMNFMDMILAPHDMRSAVAELVRHHMKKKDDEISVRKLKAELKYNSIYDLVQLIICDRNGRPPLERVSINDFYTMLYYDMVSDIEPIVTGKHLIQMGYTPGPAFKEMLRFVYNLQLANTRMTLAEGLEYVEREYPNP